MAVLAAGAQLAAVYVGVAIGAARGSFAEDHVGVALGAFHLGVHAFERVGGLAVVVDLRRGAQRLPTDGRVAVAAGDIERAVRAAHRPALRSEERRVGEESRSRGWA